jgi:hypothetical protein
MAIHIKVNDQATLINEQTHPQFFVGDGDRSMTLKAMRELVGGDIQIIRLKKPIVLDELSYQVMGVNEEGKYSGMKFNGVATRIAASTGSIMIGDVIVGDAILFTNEEWM